MTASSPDSNVSAAPPRAVFLQGPVGPFFARLQDACDAAGWSTVRIRFNSGDGAYHGAGQEIGFTEGLANWPRWFKSFLQNYKPDVVLLFGDQRPIHRSARKVAQSCGVETICFEEGYLRPDYVTMEAGGNNAGSPLRAWRTQDDEAIEVDVPRPMVPRPMPHNGFRDMARYASLYYLLMSAGVLQFPYYRHHRQRGVVGETLLWVRNAMRKKRWRATNLQRIQTIVEIHDNSYFIVALQVHDDLQLRRNGCGWTVDKLIESAIASFARHGHPEHHLVFKGHPLDRGHSAGRDFVSKLAKLHEVADRVHYVDDGSLGLMARHARGMVTINSTSAMVAFDHSKPVLALGESFYEAMTANGSDRSVGALDRFWRLTPQVDVKRWRAFRAHMTAHSLINGSFYIEDEIGPTCDRVIQRLTDRIAATTRRPASTASPGAAAEIVAIAHS